MKRLLQLAAALLLAVPTTKAQTISGALTSSSQMCSGIDGGSLSYYCDVYSFEITEPGAYVFYATSDFDSYGQLYVRDSFYYEYPFYNNLLMSDDSIDVDFGFTYDFPAGKYTMVVSTFNGLETGSYSMTASGPAELTFTSATIVAGAPPTDPLPLSLLNFSAEKRNNNSAVLNWRTAMETNVSHFDIEKSTDGINYRSIGEVTAVGNDQGGDNTYFFTDQSLMAGINTYRLKMMDMDGTFKYSDIAAVNGEIQQFQPSVYPNPTTGITTLHTSSSTAGNMNVTIADLSGRTVLNHQFKVDAGRNEHNVDISNLAPGAYILHWSNGVENGILNLVRK